MACSSSAASPFSLQVAPGQHARRAGPLCGLAAVKHACCRPSRRGIYARARPPVVRAARPPRGRGRPDGLDDSLGGLERPRVDGLGAVHGDLLRRDDAQDAHPRSGRSLPAARPRKRRAHRPARLSPSLAADECGAGGGRAGGGAGGREQARGREGRRQRQQADETAADNLRGHRRPVSLARPPAAHTPAPAPALLPSCLRSRRLRRRPWIPLPPHGLS